MQGIIVAPGVIVTDFQGEIKVMTHSPNGGQSLAQLILLPAVQTKNQIKKDKRGKERFGSPDAYLLQVLGPQRTKLTLFINGKGFLAF